MAQQQNMTGVSFADLVDRLMPGVVNISTTRSVSGEVDNFGIESGNNYIHDYFVQDEGGRTSLGSGFLIDAKGYIVTNNHVIEGADEIAVRLSDDRQFQATIVGHDKKTDLALIKIDSPEPLPFVNLGDSDTLRVGDWILAIGNPFGLGGSVTAGIVSAK
jgi:serine protease Do